MAKRMSFDTPPRNRCSYREPLPRCRGLSPHHDSNPVFCTALPHSLHGAEHGIGGEFGLAIVDRLGGA